MTAAVGVERILVTGAAGFIGSHVALELSGRGLEVRGLDVRQPAGVIRWLLARAGLDEKIDIGGVDKWSDVVAAIRGFRPDAVVHAAAIVNPVSLRVHDALRVNVGGTRNVLDASRLLGVSRVVQLSSIGVLAPRQYEPIDAAHPVITGPSGPSAGFYGASKVACEALCFAYHQAYELDFAIVRPSAVYGPGMQVDLGLRALVNAVIAGEPIRLDRGVAVARDYTYCRDVASLVAAAATATPGALGPNRIFYAASGRLTTLADAAEVVHRLVTGAAIDVDPRETEADAAERLRRGLLDIAPARTQLGHVPAYDLESGLVDYIDTMRKYETETIGEPVGRE